MGSFSGIFMEILTFYGDLDFLISMKSLDLHKKKPSKGPLYVYLA